MSEEENKTGSSGKREFVPEQLRSVDTNAGEVQFRISISGYGSDSNRKVSTSDFIIKDSFLTNLVSSLKFKFRNKFTVESIEEAHLGGFEINGEKADPIAFPTGVIGVFGKTSTGKSELMKIIATGLKAQYLRFQEPEIPAVISPHHAIKEIEDFLCSNQKYLAIDSGRFWVFNSKDGRAAGKGGISSAFYSDLTTLSVIASYLNKTIFMVINPMTDDDSATRQIASAIEGSVAGLIETRSYGLMTYVARTVENNRKNVSYSYTDENGESLFAEDFDNSYSSQSKTKDKSDGNVERKVNVVEEDHMAQLSNMWFVKAFKKIDNEIYEG